MIIIDHFFGAGGAAFALACQRRVRIRWVNNRLATPP